jgi:hypothetical protein
MFTGNRRITVTIGLIALIASAIGWLTFPTTPSPERLEYGNPRNEQHHPGGRQCEPSALRAITGAKVRLDATERCQKEAEEYRQNTDDLVQQTRAASAAVAQAEIAGQVLWMGWLQTLGGLLTLAAAVGAAIYARDAAQHTRYANEITLNAQRAWIDLNLRPLNVEKTPWGLHFKIRILATNSGGTAATHYSVKHEIISVNTEGINANLRERLDQIVSEWKTSYIGLSWRVLAPGTTDIDTLWNELEESQLAWDDVGQRTKTTHPVVIACVFYRTVSEPDITQSSWRAWMVGKIQKDGHLLNCIESNTPDLREANINVEPVTSGLVHAAYDAPANTRVSPPYLEAKKIWREEGAIDEQHNASDEDN